MSRGRTVLKSITSQEIPSFFKLSAAAYASLIIFPKDTIVTSEPVIFTSATPIGRMYSSSGTSPLSPYICSLSINITGSSSLIAAFKRPLASYGLEGTTTFKPGQLANQLSKACE